MLSLAPGILSPATALMLTTEPAAARSRANLNSDRVLVSHGKNGFHISLGQLPPLVRAF
jgi:hypothetical protein